MKKDEIERVIAECLYDFEAEHAGEFDKIKDVTEATKGFCELMGFDWDYIVRYRSFLVTRRSFLDDLDKYVSTRRSLFDD